MKKIWNVFRARFSISMKIYFRYPVNFIMTLFDPIIWLTPFYFIGKSFSSGGSVVGFERYTGNSDYMGFLIIGYMITSYVSTVFWTTGFSLKEEMRQGVLESNWCAPVNKIVMLLSKTVFYFCATTFEIILTFIVCRIAFGFKLSSDLFQAVGFLIPGIIGMIGIGMAVAALVLVAKDANPIIDLVNSVLSALSGSFFPVKVMSKGFLFVALAIPLTYVYDSSRAILINQVPLFPLWQELIIIICAMFILCFVGSFIFIKVEKKCRSLGILGTH